MNAKRAYEIEMHSANYLMHNLKSKRTPDEINGIHRKLRIEKYIYIFQYISRQKKINYK